jgi:hypothetical protein
LIPWLIGAWESSSILLGSWVLLLGTKTLGLKIKNNFLAFVFVFITRWFLFGLATILLVKQNNPQSLIEIFLLISIFVFTYLKNKTPKHGS